MLMVPSGLRFVALVDVFHKPDIYSTGLGA